MRGDRAWSALACAAMLGLAACGMARNPAATGSPSPVETGAAAMSDQPTPDKQRPSPQPAEPMNPTELPAASPSPAPTAAQTPESWQQFRSDQAGFALEFPADWTAREQRIASGWIVIEFSGPGGAFQVSVLPTVMPIEPDGVPNTRCQGVRVAGVDAMRCFDTISGSLTTTLADRRRSFVITSQGKRPNQQIYQHALDTFSLL